MREVQYFFAFPTRGSVVALFLGVLSVFFSSGTASSEPLVTDRITHGQEAFRRGAFADAISHWQPLVQSAAHDGNAQDYVTIRTQLAHAYLALGQYESAEKHLQTALALAQAHKDKKQTALIFSSLSAVALARGAVEHATLLLEEGQSIARSLEDQSLSAHLFNNLGNVQSARKQYAAALNSYKESVRLAIATANASLSANAASNAARVALLSNQPAQCRVWLDTMSDYVRRLPVSYDKASSLIALGLLTHDLRRQVPQESATLLAHSYAAFTDALRIAEHLGNARLVSYATGHLGRLYEEQHRLDEAEQLTRRAITAAQQASAAESLYRWYGQLGQVFIARGHTDAALAAYRRAVETLQSIRRPLTVQASSSVTSFRETIEPVYLTLVDLLLQRAAKATDPTQRIYDLREARQTVESLKVAELRDYFHDTCVDSSRAMARNLDELVSTGTAVLYPILLPDRTELLMSFTSGLKSTTVPVPHVTLTQTSQDFRRLLVKRTTREYRPYAQQLYDWLIRPVEADLRTSGIHTLVIVPDGPLRMIPFAALHDGNTFLVDHYAVAVTPGLELTDPRPLQRDATRLLAAGLSEAVQGFPALPHVPAELQEVRQFSPGNILLNHEFVASAVKQQLQDHPFTIVHLASHGQFKSEAKDSFILTFNDRLSLDQLGQLLGPYRFRSVPLEMLTLSACETAASDERAALGLAGVAVKAGARSALATLWLVSDHAATLVMSEVYRQLQDPIVSRAVAVQRAQLKLLEDTRYTHPGYWAPFVLINNWM